MKNNLEAIRADFPILSQPARKGHPLVYLDNAATAQKPVAVIDAISNHYRMANANINRGVHYLGEKATIAYEGARQRVARALNAKNISEVVFTRNATEAINLVAASWGRSSLKAGDVIILTMAEHHANIVPWRILADEKNLTIKVIPVDERGVLDLDVYQRYLDEGSVKLAALGYVSNVLGTVHPVEKMTQLAHAAGAKILLDAAQALPHFAVDVQKIGCDFLIFTGHKAFGPTGIGVLWARQELLEAMPPYQGGGDMIESVGFERVTFRPPPARFEAGTPSVADAVGLAAALDYVESVDPTWMKAHEETLLKRATQALLEIPGLAIQGTAPEKVSLISFTLKGIHPHDIASIVDSRGIAIRAGHHCAQPLMKHLGVPATARASFAFYNTLEEIDILVNALLEAKRLFA